jgi:ribose transport system substrate-binding protein
MKKKKNLIIILFILLIFLLQITIYAQEQASENLNSADAQQKQENKEEKITIAYVPRSLDNPIFLDAFEHSQEKALELNINLDWVSPFVYNEDNQIEIIESLIEREIDGMVVSVNNTEDYIRVINKAVEEGIAVATFDADAPDSNRLFHIGIDNYKAGQAAAEGLLDSLEKRGVDYNNPDQSLKTMVMTGVRGAVNLDLRIDGFEDKIEGTNITILDVIENQDSVNLSVELLEKYLQDNSDIDIIFFVGGWPFYVPAEALPNFQSWAESGGVAVGIDLFYDALLLQQRGLIQHLVGQDMAAMGSKGLESIYNFLKHGTVPEEFIETSLEIAEEENLDELLRKHQPWRVK